MEVSFAAGDCEPGDHGFGGGIEGLDFLFSVPGL
jgi:hypothetical protein